MTKPPYWLEAFRQGTEAIRKQTATIRAETESLRQQNASLRSLLESKEKLKQIVEASTIKPTPLTTAPDTHRQTGRTTRMLAEAFKLAREGKAVYILAADSRHMSHIEEMADSLLGAGKARFLGIKFDTLTTLSTFDFQTMQLRGAHPNCCVLVDHWTIESRYAKMLEELHRYNDPTLATLEIQP